MLTGLNIRLYLNNYAISARTSPFIYFGNYSMSRKSMIMLGMIIGSFAGGYMPILLGADAFSPTSLLGSVAGGILGIWLAYMLTR